MFSLSIAIPTFNSEKTIKSCILSLCEQDYPKEKFEIIIADAGSTDNTIKIINSVKELYPSIRITIVLNRLKTGEAGKAVACRQAKGEIIALIDSDNILPEKDWLTKMTSPFFDSEIVGSEPIEYTYRKEDGLITRYCALIGMNDPLCMFLGNYDRMNRITGKWTEMPVTVTQKDGYLKVSLDDKNLPTIGANGFLIRKDALFSCMTGDYLFDIDILWEIISTGYHYKDSLCNKIGKVKTGIIHIFSGNIATFTRKQKRRVNDFFYFKKQKVRKYPWGSVSKVRLLKFIIYTTFLIPLVLQSIIGCIKKPATAWIFHPLACIITLWVYIYGTILGIFSPSLHNRNKWSQ